MKYKTAVEMAAGLRKLADFIEEHGHELPSSYGCADPKIHLLITAPKATAKKQMAQSTKALATQGTVTKKFSFDARVVQNFGKHVEISISCAREEVCTPKVVGTKEVEETLFVKTGRTVTEDIIEWECHPILAD